MPAVSLSAGQKVIFWIVAIFFAIFVWPTPYRLDGRAKTSRLAWALNLSPERQPSGAITFGLLGFGLGMAAGYGASILRYRRKDDSSANSQVRLHAGQIRQHRGFLLGIGVVAFGLAVAVLCNKLAGDSPINWMPYLSFGGILIAGIAIAKLFVLAWQALVRYLLER